MSIGYFVWSRATTNHISMLCANYMCLRGMQVSQSGPVRTHRRRRPPSCMIVTAMIVTVSPQCCRETCNHIFSCRQQFQSGLLIVFQLNFFWFSQFIDCFSDRRHYDPNIRDDRKNSIYCDVTIYGHSACLWCHQATSNLDRACRRLWRL